MNPRRFMPPEHGRRLGPVVPHVIVETIPYHEARIDGALAEALSQHADTHMLLSVWENADGTVRAVWRRK